LQPSNCGFEVAGWSLLFKEKFAGAPVKSCAIALDQQAPRLGEFVITASGVEGSLIYALSAPIREQINQHGTATIHLDLLPPGDPVPQFGRFEDRKAHVEGVAVKDPREAPGNDTGNPGSLDRDGGMFPGGTATEVLTGYDDIARAGVPGELCIEILHAVTRQFCGIGRCQMTGRDDGIRVDIVSELPDLSFEFHAVLLRR
jgi:hypothetical protein